MEHDDWFVPRAYDIYSQKYGNKPVYKIISQQQQPKETDMTKLYEIRHLEKTLYGHKLAVNSQGLWVMEIKGTGEVLAVDKPYIEEVMPHSIGVQFETGKQVYHYLADAGRYQVGEFYILDAPHGRAVVQVTEVDTKNVNATKEFKPLAKLAVE
jgi:hypothetical protein